MKLNRPSGVVAAQARHTSGTGCFRLISRESWSIRAMCPDRSERIAQREDVSHRMCAGTRSKCKAWCGWRGSNPRPSASEADTLSTELQPQPGGFYQARGF